MLPPVILTRRPPTEPSATLISPPAAAYITNHDFESTILKSLEFYSEFPMAELSIPRVPKYQQLLSTEIEHLQPFTSPFAPFNYNDTLSPFLRGPMYTAYADLRDWKLRMKKAGLSPSTPIPLQVKRPAVMAPIPVHSAPEYSQFRKDGMNTRPPVIQRFDPSKSPSPPLETQLFNRSKMVSPPLNNETKRFGNLPSGKGDEKRGGPPRAGSGRVDEFLLMRTFSSYDDSTSINKEAGKSGRFTNKGILRKTFTSFADQRRKRTV